ncbi:serine hydrolase domain-containing protein [Streptomyces sp. NBC_01304]|uniref:serine hydrolase domain-containing protein n=1 Tax=Streptomyces sp. NBC_01304 TaxID=2903818 RepID=UPI002E108440|nr:beta-lactamase family protein [Streptomyces sp. NBC_01304]
MTNSRNSKARWALTTAAGAALVAVLAGSGPAVAAQGPDRTEAASTAHLHEPLDRPALLAALAGLPDRTVSGGLIRLTGRDGRFTKIAGPSVPRADAHFRIGSMTKLFTSTVVLQLVAEGRFTLDDTVQELAPGLIPARYRPITMGQLLSHTSGLPQPECAVEGAPEKVVAAALSCGSQWEPGTVSQYNGINYFIAGLVIEKVTGNTYGDEVRGRILRPLGLRHTFVPAAGDRSMPQPHTRAAMVRPGSDELTDTSEADPWPWAEGGMISNAPDLERFIKALYSGRLLPRAQQKQLFTVPEVAHVNGAVFTLGGVQRTELPDGTVVWGKTGSYSGYTGGVFATRDLRRVLVYSLNPTGRAPELPYVMRIAQAAF